MRRPDKAGRIAFVGRIFEHLTLRNMKIGDTVITPDNHLGEIIRVDYEIEFATVQVDIFYSNFYPIASLQLQPKQLELF